MLSSFRKPLIAVIGGRQITSEAEIFAYQTGRNIALLGAVLLCGGRSGAMEFSAKGAWENGGLTVGILPGSSSEEANPYIQIAISTGMGIARNSIIAHAADALIAIEGGYGTLSEIAFALQLNKKVFSYHSWQHTDFSNNQNYLVIDSIDTLIHQLTGFLKGG